MKKTLLILLMFLVTFSFAVSAYAEDVLKIGVAAMISPKETIKYYKEMLDFVGQKIGKKVEMVQKENYAEMDSLLEKGYVDVAFVCSGPYVKDHAAFGAELLVAPQSYGQPFYYAYIIVPKDSPAESLADLKGKRFAFTDPKSNTGKLVPTYMVAKRFGTTPEKFFSEAIFTRSHDKSIQAVAKKLVDGASVDSLIYDYTAKKNPIYTKLTKIAEKSPPYGIPPVVVNRNIDPKTKAALRDAFLNMHKDPRGREILSGIMVDKFILPEDSSYDTVREMNRFIEENK